MVGLRQNQASRFVVGNWKMSLAQRAATELAAQIAKLDSSSKACAIGVAPSYTALSECARALSHSALSLGAQNVCQFESGAYTGEISANMLKQLGCSFSLVGHSERRQIYGESIELCGARAKMALTCGLEIIFCIGETSTQRHANKTSAVIEGQLAPLLGLLEESSFRTRILIAYEPVWAIGSGVVASAEQISQAHALIAQLCGKDLPILYGGSVTPDNFKTILELPYVSGGLIGGASLDAEKFRTLVNIALTAVNP